MQRLTEVLHKAFEIVMARCAFTNGRLNYRELKLAVEKRLGVIKVLRDYGHAQGSDETILKKKCLKHKKK